MWSTASGWAASSLTGYSGLPTRWCNTDGCLATWTPTFLAAGTYDVQIWKTVSSSSDPAAPVIINSASGVSNQTINYTTGSNGWVDLGTFSFSIGSTGYVQLGFSGTGNARTSMVKFVRQ